VVGGGAGPSPQFEQEVQEYPINILDDFIVPNADDFVPESS
jgi:hypothetical protein